MLQVNGTDGGHKPSSGIDSKRKPTNLQNEILSSSADDLIEATVRVLAIGDPHFKMNNLAMMDLFVTKILKIIKVTDPDIIVVLGDTLDRHELIDMEAHSKASKFLMSLADITQTYVLIGNHDRRNNSDFQSDVHPFTGLENYENLTIVSKAMKKYIVPKRRCGENAQGANFLFVPYVPNGRFADALKTIDLTEFDGGYVTEHIDAIFAHQEFKGCKMGGIISTTGDIWELKNPLVISGHIHEQQKFENIIYTGSPLHHNHGCGDHGGKKSVGLFEFNVNYDQRAKRYVVVDFSQEALNKPTGDIRCKYFRISLGIKGGTTETIDAKSFRDDIKNIDTTAGKLKLVIRGTREELKILTSEISELRRKDIKIVQSLTKETRNKDDMKKYDGKSYMETFKELLGDNKDALMYFERMMSAGAEGIEKETLAMPGKGKKEKKKLVIEDDEETEEPKEKKKEDKGQKGKKKEEIDEGDPKSPKSIKSPKPKKGEKKKEEKEEQEEE